MEIKEYQRYYFEASWQYRSGEYYIAMNRMGREKGRSKSIFPGLVLAVIQTPIYKETYGMNRMVGWEVREKNGEYITSKRDLLPYPGDIIIK